MMPWLRAAALAALAAFAALTAAPLAAAHAEATITPDYCGPGGDTDLQNWVHPYGLHAHATASARPLGGAAPVAACVALAVDLEPPVPLPLG